MAILTTERGTTERGMTERGTFEGPATAGQPLDPENILSDIESGGRPERQTAGFWSKTWRKIGEWGEQYAEHKLRTGYWNLTRI